MEEFMVSVFSNSFGFFDRRPNSGTGNIRRTIADRFATARRDVSAWRMEAA
jgi:hypothetical protein